MSEEQLNEYQQELVALNFYLECNAATPWLFCQEVSSIYIGFVKGEFV